jgi:hypothetical protein
MWLAMFQLLARLLEHRHLHSSTPSPSPSLRCFDEEVGHVFSRDLHRPLAPSEPRVLDERSDLPYTKRSGDMVYTSWLD